MKEIVQKEDPVLRFTAKSVPEEMFSSPELEAILRDMSEALDGEEDGVAIAAPQIAVSLRIFLVSRKLFEDEEQDIEFINPVITKTSKKKLKLQEGCLSVRPLYGTVERFEKVTVVAYDKNGQKFSYGASGILAQIFQHEIDHLEGILFSDKAENLHEDEEYLKRISNIES